MKVYREIVIDSSIAKVWTLSADQFDSAYTWMTGVVHSSATHSNDDHDSPVSGRVCTLETGDNPLHALENVTKYDKANYLFEFEVIPKKKGGTGLPVVKNQVTMQLESIGPDKTLVKWQSNLTLKPIGYLLYPLLKLGLGKAFGRLLADMKHYLETGEVSQSKQKEITKLGTLFGVIN